MEKEKNYEKIVVEEGNKSIKTSADLDLFYKECKEVCNSTRIHIKEVMENTAIFPLSHKELMKELIIKGEGIFVINNFEKFTEIKDESHLEIIHVFIQADSGSEVIDNFKKFIGIKPKDHLGLIKTFIEAGDGSMVLDDFNIFTGIQEKDHLEIVKTLIKKGAATVFIDNFVKFTGVQKKHHLEIVNTLIKGGWGHLIVRYIDKFTGVETRYAREEIIKILKVMSGLAHKHIEYDLQNLKIGEREIGNVEELLPGIFKYEGIDIEKMFIDILEGDTTKILELKKEYDKAKGYISQKDINKVRALDIVMTRVKKKLMHEEIRRRNGTCSRENLVKLVETSASTLTKEFRSYMKEILSEDLYEKYAELRGCESEYFVQSV